MNLDALNSLNTTGRSGATVPPPRRRWATRVALPFLILALCGGLLAYAARDVFLPAQPVVAARVLIAEGGGAGQSGAPAVASVSVQAPGRLEPDPYPTYVTALANGIVDKVLVLEGQPIKKGDVVASLVDDDARLAVDRAAAELMRRKALQTAAQTHWDEPVALNRAVAVSEAHVEETKAELAQLEAKIAQQVARQNELQIAYDRVRVLSESAASQLEIDTAKYQLLAQQSLVEATRKQRQVITGKLHRNEADLKAAKDNLRLRVEEKRELEEATASVKEAEALLAEAKLRLERMEVVSPVAGIVMNRMVAPGAKVMFEMDSPHSAHIVHVYDPNHMQVRVDVPLADAAKIGVGQKARVIVDVLPDQEFAGRVTRFVHQADIGKNTVEVKVAIENPSPLLKPDMLTRVKFLASTSGNSRLNDSQSPSTLTVYAPVSAIVGDRDDAFVWRITPGESMLQRQPVKVGAARGDDWIAVVEGLNPGDALVAEPTVDLVEGKRVRITNTASMN